MRGNKGITLIALVITIIVLLILAGVSIAMLSGKNGILNQASKSADYSMIGEQRDELANTVNLYVSAYYEATYAGGDFGAIVGNADYTAADEDTPPTKAVPTTVGAAVLAALDDFTSTNSEVDYDYNETATGKITLQSPKYYQQSTSVDTTNGTIEWGPITEGTAE